MHLYPAKERTDVGRVVGCPENELGSAVVARADVADVGLARDEDLGGTKVAELENTGRGVEQQVLGLDVAMADADGVDVRERAEELVHVELDLELGHGLLELDVVPRGAVDGLGDVLEDEVEVDLVLLCEEKKAAGREHKHTRANGVHGTGRTFSPLE